MTVAQISPLRKAVLTNIHEFPMKMSLTFLIH